jgi:hypothetical protein
VIDWLAPLEQACLLKPDLDTQSGEVPPHDHGDPLLQRACSSRTRGTP